MTWAASGHVTRLEYGWILEGSAVSSFLLSERDTPVESHFELTIDYDAKSWELRFSIAVTGRAKRDFVLGGNLS
jgi:hypothetical protein